jgi:hypothetical protein
MRLHTDAIRADLGMDGQAQTHHAMLFLSCKQPMRDFDDSTLWRVSEFERVRVRTGESGFTPLQGATVLPETLLGELQHLDQMGQGKEMLEVITACLRHREAALLCVQYEGLVWPITVFPAQMLYHSPRDLAHTTATGLMHASLLSVEPPGVRPPGHTQHERVSSPDHYRPLLPLLWLLALEGPRTELLNEIAGTAAYRAIKNPVEDGLSLSGALGSAAERLRRETVSLRTIAQWPGMNAERASRLLNALYLASALLATRAHPAARPAPGAARGLRDLFKSLR